MVNGMLDIGDDDGLQGFIGGGIGYAKIKANNWRRFDNAAPFLDDSDSRLAWQALAGVRAPLTENNDVQLKDRFFNVAALENVAFNGAQPDYSFRSHSLPGGIATGRALCRGRGCQ